MKKLLLVTLSILLFACTPKVIKEPPPKVEEPAKAYLWVFKKSINVRSNNSANSIKIMTLSDGDSVQVLQNKEGWYEVILANGSNGWIRSDLLGTKEMSVFPKAVDFSNKLKDAENITLYFDKELQHKRIFLEFPQSDYKSKKDIETTAKKIGNDYQDQVYPGNVTLIVINPGDQSEYLNITLPAAEITDLDLPVLKYGILSQFKNSNNNELDLQITVREDIEKNSLLEEARKIVRSFPLILNKVKVIFKNKSEKCILTFIEDTAGELYKYNQCL